MLTTLKMRREGVQTIKWQVFGQVKKQVTIKKVWGSVRIFVQHLIEAQIREQISGALHVRHRSSVGAVRYGLDAWGDY